MPDLKGIRTQGSASWVVGLCSAAGRDLELLFSFSAQREAGDRLDGSLPAGAETVLARARAL